MAGRGHSRCRGGGKAGRGHGIRAVLARMHGLVKLGSCSGVGKIGSGGSKKQCTCGGRIEGLGGRILIWLVYMVSNRRQEGNKKARNLNPNIIIDLFIEVR
ncbi:unnamed protein product [Urochloa humidicola]